MIRYKKLALLNNIMKSQIKLFLSSNDRYQRYSEIAKYVSPKEKVLDVGGGEGLISKFISNDITILDINKDELEIAKKQGLKTIHVDLINNKIKDNYYNTVISVATLEHISPDKREFYLKELKRIAKDKIIIFTPIGSSKYDKILYNFKKVIGIKDPWTLEHIKNGLPQLKDLKKIFSNAEIKLTQNAYLWLMIMFLQSMPLINKFLPGIVYLILKPINSLKPHTACILISKK